MKLELPFYAKQNFRSILKGACEFKNISVLKLCGIKWTFLSILKGALNLKVFILRITKYYKIFFVQCFSNYWKCLPLTSKHFLARLSTDCVVFCTILGVMISNAAWSRAIISLSASCSFLGNGVLYTNLLILPHNQKSTGVISGNLKINSKAYFFMNSLMKN